MNLQSVEAVAYLGVGLLVALVVHEYAHAWMALRLGDATPRQAGRLSLDPRPHVEPFGTLVLPGILLLITLFGHGSFNYVFAYAKPQPLSPWSLRRQDRHVTLISLAGPAANVALALLFGGILRAAPGTGQVSRLVAACLLASVSLAATNLFPIPPLDMSRVVARFLPPRAREVMGNMEQYGALFILLLFFIIPGPLFAFVRVIGNGICQATAGASCFA